MRYLYGDGSEFPLGENFLQTLSAATDACVALLEVDEAHDRVQRTLEEANAALLTELAEIGALRGALERVLDRATEARPSLRRVAAQLRKGLSGQVENARAEIKLRREQAVHKAHRAQDPTPLLTALEQFLAHYQLPNTTWALSWAAGCGAGRSTAHAYALMPRGLAATLEIHIPASHPWFEPVKVARLARNLIIRLEGTDWLGRVRLRDELLDRYYVTHVVHTPMREALLLSKDGSRPSPGIQIVFREQHHAQVVAVRVDALGNPCGDPVVLMGADKVMLQELWANVQRTIRDLIHHRRRVETATLNGKPVVELERPVPVVRALLSAVAPWARNIRRRSNARGQLALRQQRGDGAQQELLLSYYALIRKYRHLSAEHRSLFDTLGLTDEPHAEVQTRAWQPQRTAQPAAEAASPSPVRPDHRPSYGPPPNAVRGGPSYRPRISAVVPAGPGLARPPIPPPQPLPSAVTAAAVAEAITAQRLPPTQPPPPAAGEAARSLLPPPAPLPREARAPWQGTPPTVPPPPLESYEGRTERAPSAPPPLPQVAAAGGRYLPPLIPPPAPAPHRETLPTRPVLRVIRGSG